MIKDFEFFHGVVFSRILHGSQRPLFIQLFPSTSNASYVFDKTIGIYIKYSAKRLTPWHFTFKREHVEEIELMKRNFKDVFLVLVCNDDGMVCLNYAEFKEILNGNHDSMDWISAARHKREMYEVKGSGGRLDLRVGQNDFPQKIFGG